MDHWYWNCFVSDKQEKKKFKKKETKMLLLQQLKESQHVACFLCLCVHDAVRIFPSIHRSKYAHSTHKIPNGTKTLHSNMLSLTQIQIEKKNCFFIFPFFDWRNGETEFHLNCIELNVWYCVSASHSSSTCIKCHQ